MQRAVYAAAPDKAGRGGVELWIRQDIMGDPRSFVAEPRFLLVKGHTAAGVIQFCVCLGSDSTRDQAEIQAWRRTHPKRMSGFFTARGAMRCNCAGWICCVAGRWRSGGGLGGCCQARTMTLPSLPGRGVPQHGGIGKISWLCLAIGSLR